MTPPTKMPASVQIGAVLFGVTTDPIDWVKMEHSRQVKGYYGHTDCTTARIFVNPDCPTGVQRLTLWHEVLHALAETVMGKPDWRHLGKEVDDREETVVRAWEHPTLAVMRDNPDLMAYLAGADQ